MDIFDGNIDGGDDWRHELSQAVDSSCAMISVICPSYLKSKYCMRELRRADDMDIPIIPIIFIELPNRTDWPIELQDVQYIDFQNWQSDSEYSIQLDKLNRSITAKCHHPEKHLIDAEQQYLNSFITQLESRTSRGVLEYVDLEGLEPSNEEVRPIPDNDEWGFEHLLVKQPTDLSLESSKALRFEGRKNTIIKISNIFSTHSHFVLLGAPGAGKTTTIRYMARNFARKRLLAPQSSLLPILRYLPKWSHQDTFDEFVQGDLPREIHCINLVENGQAILFLDGLNEMGASGQQRLQIIEGWLNRQKSNYFVVITCREADYTKLNLEQMPQIIIRELHRQQIERFVANYLADKKSEFLQYVYDPSDENHYFQQGLQRLARNPYMLSALIIIFQAENELPQNAGDLFRRLSKALWEREKKRNTIGWIPFDEAENLFAKLAFQIIEEDLPIDFPLNFAMECIGKHDFSFLEAGQRANFIEVDHYKVRFYHQLMLEYFAAVELSKHDISDYLEDINRSIADIPLRSSTKWDRVIIALCGLTSEPDQTLLVIAQHDPHLALMCIESGIKVTEDTQSQITQGLAELGLVFDEFYDSYDFEYVIEAYREFSIDRDEIQSIWSLYYEHSTEWLCDVLLNDWRSEAREVAALMLYTVGDDTVVPFLQESLKDDNWYVASASALALIRLGNSEIRDFALQWYRNQHN